MKREDTILTHFDLSELFKHAKSLKKLNLMLVVPYAINKDRISTLINSNTLEHLHLTVERVSDHNFELFLKIPSLHTIICESVTELTGVAFASDEICAPIRNLKISRCHNFSQDGLACVFQLSTIKNFCLDDLPFKYEETVSLREFILDDLRGSRLAQTLRRFSMDCCDLNAELIRIMVNSMPSLTHLGIHDPYAHEVPAEDTPEYQYINWAKVEEYKLPFPNVSIQPRKFRFQ